MDSNNNNEITLRELIITIKEYIKEIFRSRLLVLVTCGLSVAYFAYKHYSFQPSYTAEVKFMVEGQSGVGGGLNSLLGTFGIKKSSKVNPYKILEVARSPYLLENSIAKVKGSNQIIASDIINVYDLRTKWQEANPDFNPYDFDDNLDSTSIDRSKTMKLLYNMLWGTPDTRKSALANISLNDETGIYSLRMESLTEDLSKNFVNEVYSGIKSFFEDEMYSNQKRTVEILKLKADSLMVERNSLMVKLASYKDSSRGILSKVNESKAKILEQNIYGLNAAYVEVLKNYQLTDINLKDMQPLFMAIAKPDYPISPSKSSLITKLILGLILGGLLSIMIVVFRKIYRDIMHQEQ